MAASIRRISSTGRCGVLLAIDAVSHECLGGMADERATKLCKNHEIKRLRINSQHPTRPCSHHYECYKISVVIFTMHPCRPDMPIHCLQHYISEPMF